jgi:hypothetical protein
MVKDNELSIKRSEAGRKGGFASSFAKAKSEANTENENEDEIDIKGGVGGILNYHQLMNYAKKVYSPYEVNFDKEKNIFRFPPCKEQTTEERAKWHSEWKPKIKLLNDKLIEINQ